MKSKRDRCSIGEENEKIKATIDELKSLQKVREASTVVPVDSRINALEMEIKFQILKHKRKVKEIEAQLVEETRCGKRRSFMADMEIKLSKQQILGL
ncbi:hypothetical protein L2E82_12500 [Cichorium intybus]|uniref:Uncharacterized protein n=1 Tax=Cichorium intybus TaxID=13427 RepID=A0ACB9GG41_CICIN|nr:hypothetical protein L2E82_12500 [Cichorium intybus]